MNKKNSIPFKIFIPPRKYLSEEELSIEKDYIEILEILKHMSYDFVINLFKSINTDNIISIKLNKIGFMFEHYFVYIQSLIFINDNKIEENIIVNQMFYKSSGLSRKTGLEGIWLPTVGINNLKFIKKLEDEYIFEYDNLKTKKIYDKKYINKDLLIYGRFINKINTIISKILLEEEQKYPDIFKGKKIVDSATDDLILKLLSEKYNNKPFYLFNEIIPDLDENIIKIDRKLIGGNYYMKYKKYKNKYILLKNKNNN